MPHDPKQTQNTGSKPRAMTCIGAKTEQEEIMKSRHQDTVDTVNSLTGIQSLFSPSKHLLRGRPIEFPPGESNSVRKKAI